MTSKTMNKATFATRLSSIYELFISPSSYAFVFAFVVYFHFLF